MTSEQLEAARAERMRQNGHGALTLEDSRIWLEETGLCLFLPKKQLSSSLAPSFVEAVAGQRNSNPSPAQIAAAEELLVRLELDGVAVRLNLLGQPGEHPDYVVAAWVLPYVYALRGDRDWRRSPQLTGSRQVSPLAIQAYKHLEGGDATIAALKQALGQGVSETAVLRAITELWQQLRIIPVLTAPRDAAKWQLLRQRFQKAIAEGASTSQVTAISVLASIFLQAVIAATMEEVEIFLAPLTARSKIREVLRGLVATRQVHTLSLGHAPHFYVAGTLPEFAAPTTAYASSAIPGSSYFDHFHDHDYEDIHPESGVSATVEPKAEAVPVQASAPREAQPVVATPAVRKPAASPKPSAPRPHFSRPAAHSRDRKPAPAASARSPRRPADSRPSARPAAAGRTASASGSRSGHTASASFKNGSSSNGNGHAARSSNGSKSAKPATSGWSARGAQAPKSSASTRSRSAVASRSTRKPALATGTAAGRGYSSKQGTKKRG